MRMLRVLLAIALLCGLAGQAKAFQIVVVDPYSTVPIFTSPFTVTFAPCAAGQLPADVVGTYAGCFSGVNHTHQVWLGIDLTFGDTSSLHSQPSVCSLDGTADIYREVSCPPTDGSVYFLSFDTGSIQSEQGFVIAESGVDPSSFPPITVTVTTPSPEPGSVWLLSTGVLAAGFFFARRRPLVFYPPSA